MRSTQNNRNSANVIISQSYTTYRALQQLLLDYTYCLVTCSSIAFIRLTNYYYCGVHQQLCSMNYKSVHSIVHSAHHWQLELIVFCACYCENHLTIKNMHKCSINVNKCRILLGNRARLICSLAGNAAKGSSPMIYGDNFITIYEILLYTPLYLQLLLFFFNNKRFFPLRRNNIYAIKLVLCYSYA